MSGGIEAACFARIGKDAETKMVKNGELFMATFNAAVEQAQQSDDNPPTWIRVVLFGEKAEALDGCLLKGVKVYVQGRLSVRQAAQIMGVSERSIYTAKRIRKLRPDLAAECEAGRMSLNEALRIAEGRAKPTSWGPAGEGMERSHRR